ncbi:Dolichyl-phosphate beta-D-mannosyltransferase [Rippkaea orientalis PCC 8801]|uniref:Dolichol-phosphate mannosyltransferase n=1 Tax=Rippkaea orientalis (strain PCC 8801 / RF-1) TaxID=41431 RepID=B7K4C9_RIPO1|nr:glycosyltransferase [Rippkaea orientalis]ACK67835.1 Dolichyl-phosphate beta-D-mannosyltransferase [Rippkaea orientalis PCC 8801]
MNESLVPVPTGLLQISESSTRERGDQENALKFSLVLPTYNEAGNIAEIVKILSQLLDGYLPGQYELIVVDDNSPDQTWKLALELTPDYPQLRVMRRVDEKGLSTAVIRGWQVAQGEILGVIDADLQHPPEVLGQLLQEMEKGADLALASRHVEGGGVSEWSIIRRFLSRGAQMLGLLILPEVISRLSDPMSGYFMVRRSAIAGKSLSPVGYKILIEVAARGRIRWIAEAGYVFRERQAGESKVTWKQYIEYIQHLLRLRLSISARFIQFCLVGLSGVVVDMGFLYLLSDPSTLGLPLTRSKIIAAELAIINNFIWNDFWTFGDIARRQPGKRQRLKRLIKFNIICLVGLILNVLLLNVFFNVFNLNRYIANLLAIGLVTFFNFWFNLKLSWRVTEIK